MHLIFLLQFTHVIMDEVHERDKDMDFLLILTRYLYELRVDKDIKGGITYILSILKLFFLGNC